MSEMDLVCYVEMKISIDSDSSCECNEAHSAIPWVVFAGEQLLFCPLTLWNSLSSPFLNCLRIFSDDLVAFVLPHCRCTSGREISLLLASHHKILRWP
jgi:hypothetical protein